MNSITSFSKVQQIERFVAYENSWTSPRLFFLFASQIPHNYFFFTQRLSGILLSLYGFVVHSLDTIHAVVVHILKDFNRSSVGCFEQNNRFPFTGCNQNRSGGGKKYTRKRIINQTIRDDCEVDKLDKIVINKKKSMRKTGK